MDLSRWMQSLHSPSLPENRFEGVRNFKFCMRKTQERLLQTIRDLPHLSRLRLRYAIALQSGPANHLEG
jgi:hypothetical protein